MVELSPKPKILAAAITTAALTTAAVLGSVPFLRGRSEALDRDQPPSAGASGSVDGKPDLSWPEFRTRVARPKVEEKGDPNPLSEATIALSPAYRELTKAKCLVEEGKLLEAYKCFRVAYELYLDEPVDDQAWPPSLRFDEFLVPYIGCCEKLGYHEGKSSLGFERLGEYTRILRHFNQGEGRVFLRDCSASTNISLELVCMAT